MLTAAQRLHSNSSTQGTSIVAGSWRCVLLLAVSADVHRGFFGSVARHLKPGGVVVLQENNTGSTPATFSTMIADAGLRLVFVQDASDTRTAQSHMFYLGIMRAGDAVPAWARD